MDNNFAIESFIEYCDSMMIVNEGFNTKNIVSRFLEKIKKICEWFRKVFRTLKIKLRKIMNNLQTKIANAKLNKKSESEKSDSDKANENTSTNNNQKITISINKLTMQRYEWLEKHFIEAIELPNKNFRIMRNADSDIISDLTDRVNDLLSNYSKFFDQKDNGEVIKYAISDIANLIKRMNHRISSLDAAFDEVVELYGKEFGEYEDYEEYARKKDSNTPDNLFRMKQKCASLTWDYVSNIGSAYYKVFNSIINTLNDI